MASETHKNVSLVLLGIVAVTAIVGLVLLFVQTGPTGQGVYGGATKGIEYPNWEGRSGASSAWGDDTYRGGRDPDLVWSTRSSCGAGEFRVTQDKAAYYENQRGCRVYEHPTLGELWCVDASNGCLS